MRARTERPEHLEDDELKRLISERIDEDPAFWTGGGRRRTIIMVDVEDGYVTLTGTVRSALDRRRADILCRALGAAGVDNRLRVVSENTEGSDLKRRSA